MLKTAIPDENTPVYIILSLGNIAWRCGPFKPKESGAFLEQAMKANINVALVMDVGNCFDFNSLIEDFGTFKEAIETELRKDIMENGT
jgi:hypothetical protein